MSDRSEDVSKALGEIFQMTREEIEARFDSCFYLDKKQLKDEVNRERTRLLSRHIFDVTQADGKTVLDLGCGVGLYAIYMASFGAKQVVAVDYTAPDIESARKVSSYVKPPLTNFQAIVGDVLKLPYENASFDIVTCRDAISHIREPYDALQEMYRVLKKDGVLWLQDGNNALDIIKHSKRRKHWKKAEYGPVSEEGLRKCTEPISAPGSSADDEYALREQQYRAKMWNAPFFEIRKEMIKHKFPALDIATVDFLAEETKGMWGEQINTAVESYLKNGTVGNKQPYICRDPIMGEADECEFNPFEMRRKIQDFGFSASVIRPYYAPLLDGAKKPTLRELVRHWGAHTIQVLYPATVFIASTFEIVARKRG